MSVGRAASSLWRLRKGQRRDDVLALAGLSARQAVKLVQKLIELVMVQHRMGAVVELLELTSLGARERAQCARRCRSRGVGWSGRRADLGRGPRERELIEPRETGSAQSLAESPAERRLPKTGSDTKC